MTAVAMPDIEQQNADLVQVDAIPQREQQLPYSFARRFGVVVEGRGQQLTLVH